MKKRKMMRTHSVPLQILMLTVSNSVVIVFEVCALYILIFYICSTFNNLFLTLKKHNYFAVVSGQYLFSDLFTLSLIGED